MSKTATYPLNVGADLNEVVKTATQNLQSQGYEVSANVMSEKSASLLVTKDNDGLKKIIGLGSECSANIVMFGEEQLTVTIDTKWTNQIIAILIGWFFCLVPFITGVVGAISLNGLPQKIINAIQSGIATANDSALKKSNQTDF